jgi:hypothetical protein
MEDAWNRAVRAAGIAPSRVHLLPIPGVAVRGFNQAACYPPDIGLVDDPVDLLRGAMLVEANLPEHRAKHRIAIYEDVDSDDRVAVATMAGTLRHELRHAEQRDACGGELFSLDELAGQLVSWKVAGLPRGGLLYHLKPIEVDANAASAMFLRQSYGDAVEAILKGEDGVLARSNTAPGDLLDLPAKTVAFMFCFREVAEDPIRCSSGLSFARRLGLIDQRWTELWAALAASRQRVQS